ncbi:MAG: glycoside hydrolase family 3 N-terminal domain-containing protein, partial [Thermocrispum sp.]
MAPVKNTPKEWAKLTNAVQRYAIKHSRLGIPIVYGVDAVHGHNNVLGATMFPHQIGLGATWNPDLVADVARSTQRATAATGTPWNFSPVADLARDHRWGRYYETYAEDPLLAGALAASTVQGTEDGSSGRAVASTVKHFAGYSQPGNGHDRVPGDMSMRYLQDTILPPYRQAVQADPDTVMVNSGAINGIPAHASKYLLTDVLRKQWGFDGLVVSDWDDLESLQTKYHAAADYPAAIAKAVNAGVDMAMLPPDDTTFHSSLLTAIDEGLISRKRLNQAAGRVLALKFKLGLFEEPYVDPAEANDAVLGADKKLARRAAADSSVLLRNQGRTLPLTSKAKKIVVAGPSADNLPNQLGGWSIGWQGVPEGVTVPGTTVAEGLKAGAPEGTKVSHVADPAKAVEQAKGADAVVVVVGEKPGAEGPADAPRPALAASQQDLVRDLEATGTPVVEVVVAGRPLVLGAAAEPDALLMAWLPGTEGGHAVADVLFGKTNPSGRLPVSWPKSLGNDPLYYQQLPGPNSGPESSYHVAYPFGAGLSYTTFATGKPKLDDTTVSPRDTVRVKVPVSNSGKRAGVLVVPVYAAQPVSDVVAPPKRLVGFTRVKLYAGERRT